jgi:hypothetical protein
MYAQYTRQFHSKCGFTASKATLAGSSPMFIIASPGVTDVVDSRLVSTPEATIKPVGEGLDDVVLDTGLTHVSRVSTVASISWK